MCVLYGFVETSLGTKLIENDKVYGEKMQNIDDDWEGGFYKMVLYATT